MLLIIGGPSSTPPNSRHQLTRFPHKFTPSHCAFHLGFGLGPGRPPGPGENCQIFDNLSTPTQGQGAKKHKVSRPLINDAYKVADPNGRVAPEVREAVRQGIVTVSDAVKDTVGNAAQDVQREALSLVKDGRSRTMAAAVAKVAKEEREERERQDEPLIKLDRPTRLGKSLVLHGCSVDRLKRGLKPGTVDLVLAHLPDYVRLELFYKIAELADHVLSDTGVLVVVWAGGPLREMLDGLSRGARGMEFIADFSAIFPAPITELEVPHNTQIRRAALLVFGKQGAVLPQGDDIIEVPAPAGGIADNFMDLKDCLPLVVARFASRGRNSVSQHSRTTAAQLLRPWQPVAPSSPPTRTSRSSTTWSGGCQSPRTTPPPMTRKASEPVWPW